MDVAEYVKRLRAEGERLAEAAGWAGLEAPVPTCPGWCIADLLTHVGGVHRWAAAQVRSGQPEPLAAAFPEQTLDGYRESLRDLLHAEGQRVQREISGYAQLSQAAMKSTRMISDNVTQWKRAADGLRNS